MGGSSKRRKWNTLRSSVFFQSSNHNFECYTAVNPWSSAPTYFIHWPWRTMKDVWMFVFSCSKLHLVKLETIIVWDAKCPGDFLFTQSNLLSHVHECQNSFLTQCRRWSAVYTLLSYTQRRFLQQMPHNNMFAFLYFIITFLESTMQNK